MSVAQVPAQIDRSRIEQIVTKVLRARLSPRPAERSPLVVNISVRHVHTTQEHLEILFGPGAELTAARWLYQERQLAGEQTVDLVGPKRRMLHEVRILGPVRSATQPVRDRAADFA